MHDPIHVAVGSQNPVKVAAVERAFDRFAPTVSAHAVDSGVAAQPRSVAETVDGAKNRAIAVVDASDRAAYGVGLEGGVAHVDGVDGLFLCMWASVTDGSRVEVGAGPSVRLPASVRRRLDDGAELGPVVDEVVGTNDAARGAGAIGQFTAGAVDRTDGLTVAVHCALAPFLDAHYDDG